MPDPSSNAKTLRILAIDCSDRGGLHITIPHTLATEIAGQLVGLNAEYRKNFDLLCKMEEELAKAQREKRLFARRGLDPATHMGETIVDQPELARLIVAAVEANLQDRSGLSWDNLEDESAIQDLRESVASDVLAGLVANTAKEE